MFTGIIEAVGTLISAEPQSDNLLFTLSSAISNELQTDQSLSHNGVCLTVTAVENDRHQAVAIAETLSKSNLGALKAGDKINLERSLTFDKRLDGHLVQGHVDATGICISSEEKNGSYEFRFRFPKQFSHLIIEKGSIALNGISLTVFNVTEDEFTIAVIPYTYEHTNMHLLQVNDKVNLEFDLIGKYVLRQAQHGRGERGREEGNEKE
jgi:riboflavin synthase